MILNRNEKETLWNLFENGEANGEEMIDAVITEVIKRLASGVSMEPVAEVENTKGNNAEAIWINHSSRLLDTGEKLYTATAIAAARVQMNEACIAAIDKYWEENGDVQAEAPSYVLRALLGKEQS